MNQWVVFVQERFPPLPYVAFVLGLTLSGLFLIPSIPSTFSWSSFLCSFFGILFALFFARLTGDVSDLDKDKIAYPDRPLPRGVMTKGQALRGSDMLQIILFVYALVIWVVVNEVAALVYAGAICYVWWLKQTLQKPLWNRHPLLMSMIRQVFIVPIACFSVTVAHGNAISFFTTWSYAMMLLAVCICYNICLKLDPRTHPIVASPIHLYGFRTTFEIAALFVVAAAFFSFYAGVFWVVLPADICVIAALALLFFQPRWFEVPKLIAGLALMLHAWAVVLYAFTYAFTR